MMLLSRFFKIFVALLSFSQIAIAQVNPTLEDAMEIMGKNLRTISKVLVKHETLDAEILKSAAHALTEATIDAAKFTPRILLDAHGNPDPKYAADIAKYNDMMTKLIVSVQKLEAALDANDLAAAEQILVNEVNPARQAGHDAFRPQQ